MGIYIKSLFLIGVITLSAWSLALGQTSEKKGLSNAKNEGAIGQVVADFIAAWNKHDAKAFSMVFSENADFTNVAGVSASGRTEVEKFHASRFATSFKNSNLMATGARIRFIKPDVAAADVKWEMTGATDGEGKILALRKGLLNFVMAKDNGKWLIVVMHNMNLPTSP